MNNLLSNIIIVIPVIGAILGLLTWIVAIAKKRAQAESFLFIVTCVSIAWMIINYILIQRGIL